MSDRIAVVTAVGPETRAALQALRRPTRIPLPGFRAWQGNVGGRPATLVQSGIGAERARAALEALGGAFGLVVSAGFAGALVAGAAPGDVVLPGRVVWQVGTHIEQYDVPVAAWKAARAALPARYAARTLQGPLLSSRTIVASVAGKREAALATGAVAVEMEAAGLIVVARERNVGFLTLRTVLDAADVSLEGLPPDLDSSWSARARLVGMPAAWPRVLALTRQIPRAAQSLADALAAALPAL